MICLLVCAGKSETFLLFIYLYPKYINPEINKVLTITIIIIICIFHTCEIVVALFCNVLFLYFLTALVAFWFNIVVEVSFGAIVVVTVSADGGAVLYSGKVGMSEVVETARSLDVVIGVDVDVDNIDVVAVGRNVDVSIEVK